jgi:S1-C subfamily serine protease
LVLAIALGLAIGVSVGGPRAGGPHDEVASSAALPPEVTPSAGALALQGSLVAALQSASPSVVEIATSSGLGSGIVYDTRGDIVTNAHVVGSAQRFEVLLPSGKTVSANLVGTFAADDLAVIRLTTAAAVRPARFADSNKLVVGDIVLAVGSPYGLAGSATDGIVSSTGRAVSEGNGVLLPDAVQTSAAINPGNSGGALVNLSGAVVGIPTLAATSESGGAAAGIGFAIPSNTVTLIAPQLIKSGKVTSTGRAALGLSGQGVASSGVSGVYVTSVVTNGPAARAGIGVGDIIVAIGGRAVPSFADLQEALAHLKAGATTKVKVVHPDGRAATLVVRLGDLAGV